ncbi:hypothetical protein [Methanocella arvoryzae]|nr:hypothetical protein [Methanocella arvoryzae]
MMCSIRIRHLTIAVLAAIAILSLVMPAAALNPQPLPPGVYGNYQQYYQTNPAYSTNVIGQQPVGYTVQPQFSAQPLVSQYQPYQYGSLQTSPSDVMLNPQPLPPRDLSRYPAYYTQYRAL